MRPTQLFTSLYLAQAALAAPILLVAGSSAKAVFIRPARQMSVAETAQIVLKHDSKHHRDASRPSAAWKATPASALDAEGPLTTSELMALSQIPDSTTITTSPSPAELPPQQHHQDDDVSTTHAAKPVTTTTLSSNKGKISVGTLVVPGSSRAKTLMSQLFDSKTPRPYLVPGYYVSSQRADGFVVAIILAFVLVVVAVETWGPVSRTASWIFRREQSIRLEEASDLKGEDGQRVDYESDNDDDDDMAPFGATPHQSSPRGFALPEKVDEKAGWV